MISCTLGRIDGAVVRSALSGFTFAEVTVPVELYSDTPEFMLTTDHMERQYKVMGSEVYMRAGEKTVVRVSAILSEQEKWLRTTPRSYDSAEVADVLKGLGIKGGPKMKVSLLNLFLTDGQLAILLANMSTKEAFVDFVSGEVRYYSDLYKQKPLQVPAAFRRIYGRAPIAGYLGWASGNTGVYSDDTQVVLPFGHFDNLDRSVMDNVVNNCNGIAKMFCNMQIFTSSSEMEIGSTVLSPLTNDKLVMVASEMQFDVNGNVTAVYHCV